MRRRNLYTLENEIPGKEHLNGRVFMVKCKGVGNHAVFIDPTMPVPISYFWETSTVNSILPFNDGKGSNNGIVLSTDNTVYRLLDVSSILPTVLIDDINDISTFRDIKRYISTVKVDKYGYHDIKYRDNEYPKLLLQIHGNSVDICTHEKDGDNPIPIISLRFFDNVCKIYQIDMPSYHIICYKDPGINEFDLDSSLSDMINKINKCLGEYRTKIFCDVFCITSTPELKVIDQTDKHKSINYGDGYDLIDFVFNRAITKDEFIEFCKSENLPVNETQDYPFQDYVVISGDGNKWQWKKILCYDD